MNMIANTHTCPRCSGTGRYSYHPIYGTVFCLQCRSSGLVKGNPPTPTTRWAVFGTHRSIGARVRLYDVDAKTAEGAINRAREIFTQAGQAFRDDYTLERAWAIRFQDMADEEAISWEEAIHHYQESTTKLSERVRPGSECAPWVHAEIVKLESRVIEPDTLKRIQHVCEHVLSTGEHPLNTAAEMQDLIDAIEESLNGGN